MDPRFRLFNLSPSQSQSFHPSQTVSPTSRYFDQPSVNVPVRERVPVNLRVDGSTYTSARNVHCTSTAVVSSVPSAFSSVHSVRAAPVCSFAPPNVFAPRAFGPRYAGSRPYVESHHYSNHYSQSTTMAGHVAIQSARVEQRETVPIPFSSLHSEQSTFGVGETERFRADSLGRGMGSRDVSQDNRATTPERSVHYAATTVAGGIDFEQSRVPARELSRDRAARPGWWWFQTDGQPPQQPRLPMRSGGEYRSQHSHYSSFVGAGQGAYGVGRAPERAEVQYVSTQRLGGGLVSPSSFELSQVGRATMGAGSHRTSVAMGDHGALVVTSAAEQSGVSLEWDDFLNAHSGESGASGGEQRSEPLTVDLSRSTGQGGRAQPPRHVVFDTSVVGHGPDYFEAPATRNVPHGFRYERGPGEPRVFVNSNLPSYQLNALAETFSPNEQRTDSRPGPRESTVEGSPVKQFAHAVAATTGVVAHESQTEMLAGRSPTVIKPILKAVRSDAHHGGGSESETGVVSRRKHTVSESTSDRGRRSSCSGKSAKSTSSAGSRKRKSDDEHKSRKKKRDKKGKKKKKSGRASKGVDSDGGSDDSDSPGSSSSSEWETISDTDSDAESDGDPPEGGGVGSKSKSGKTKKAKSKKKSPKVQKTTAVESTSSAGTVLEDSVAKLAKSMDKFVTTPHMQYVPPAVPRFNAMGRLDIHAWLASMKAHFKVMRLTKNLWAEQAAAHFDSRLHREVKELPVDSWKAFAKAAVEAFRTGDVAAQAGEELRNAKQRRTERCADFMARVKRLVGKTYPTMPKVHKDRLVADHFVSGLYDERIRLQVSDHIPLERSEKVKLHHLETVASRAATAVQSEQKSVLDDEYGTRGDREHGGGNAQGQSTGQGWAAPSFTTESGRGGARRHGRWRGQGNFVAAPADQSGPVVDANVQQSNDSSCYALGDNSSFRGGRGRGGFRGGGHGAGQGGNDQAAETRKCYNCNQVGHLSRQCPFPQKQVQQKAQTQQQQQPPAQARQQNVQVQPRGPLQPPPYQQQQQQQPRAQQQGPRMALTAQPQQQQYYSQQQGQNDRGQYGYAHPGPSVNVMIDIEAALREQLGEFCGATGAASLFWAPVRVGQHSVNALMDTGASRNFISGPLLEEVAKSMPLDKPREEVILAGDNLPMSVSATVVLDFQLAGFWLRHRFNVSPNLPIGMLISGEVLQEHKASLTCGDIRTIRLGTPSCYVCERLRLDRTAIFALQPARMAPFLDLPVARTELAERVGHGDGPPQSGLRPGPKPPEPKGNVCGQKAPAGYPSGPDVLKVALENGGLEWRDGCLRYAKPRETDSRIIPAASECGILRPELATVATRVPAPMAMDPRIEIVLGKLKPGAWPLTPQGRRKAEGMIAKYVNAFSVDEYDLGHSELVKHRIDTMGAAPIKQPVRRVPLTKEEFVEGEVQRLLSMGVIRPSSSEWSSPVVVVPRKDGNDRMCIDLRRVNAVTRKDVYPLPRIDEVMDQLKGACVFSKWDLKQGFYQVEMDPDDIDKTAFAYSGGLFEFVRMPFGLTNAPATFQRLMDRVFADRHGHGLQKFLDDLLTHSPTLEEHFENDENVLIHMIENNLKLNADKVELFKTRIDFLGFEVHEGAVSPSTKKIEAVREWPRPMTGAQMMRFLGLCNFYRKFVDHFAETTRPLYDCGQMESIEWTPARVDAFEAIKAKMCAVTSLSTVDRNAPFILETDASGIGLGACLKQVQDGKEVVLAYFSCGLTSAEKNYSTFERELYAVVRACENFRVYLLGQRFTLRTDHAALRYLFQTEHRPCSRVERWVMKLQPYNVHIELIPGKLNVMADALSRMFETKEEARESLIHVDPRTGTPFPPSTAMVAVPEWVDEFEILPKLGEFVEMQLADPALSAIRAIVSGGRPEVPQEVTATPFYRGVLQQRGRLCVRQGLLLLSGANDGDGAKLVVPQCAAGRVAWFFHRGPGSAHQGRDSVLERMGRSYWWPNMRAVVRQVSDMCETCDEFRQARTGRAELHPIECADRSELVAIDMWGGQQAFPPTPEGNSIVLVMVDHFTKYAELVALPDQKAATIAVAFEKNWILRHGAPLKVLSDNGPCFRSAEFESLLALYRIAHSNSTAYHPEGNGAVERLNRTMKAYLQKVVADHGRRSDWDRLLPKAVFVYNTTVHRMTGSTPFRLHYGWEARIPGELQIGLPKDKQLPSTLAARLYNEMEKCYAVARETMAEKRKYMKSTYDAGAVVRAFEIGDRVRIKLKGVRGKLEPRWSSLYIVRNVHGVDVELEDPNDGSRRFEHHNRISNVSRVPDGRNGNQLDENRRGYGRGPDLPNEVDIGRHVYRNGDVVDRAPGCVNGDARARVNDPDYVPRNGSAVFREGNPAREGVVDGNIPEAHPPRENLQNIRPVRNVRSTRRPDYDYGDGYVNCSYNFMQLAFARTPRMAGRIVTTQRLPPSTTSVPADLPVQFGMPPARMNDMQGRYYIQDGGHDWVYDDQSGKFANLGIPHPNYLRAFEGNWPYTWGMAPDGGWSVLSRNAAFVAAQPSRTTTPTGAAASANLFAMHPETILAMARQHAASQLAAPTGVATGFSPLLGARQATTGANSMFAVPPTQLLSSTMMDQPAFSQEQMAAMGLGLEAQTGEL